MIAPGRHELTDRDAELLLHTTCEGPARRLGHDLTLVVGSWDATLHIGETAERSALDVVARLDTLAVRDSAGGGKRLSDADRRDIERNARTVLGVERNPELRFVSTQVAGTWQHGEVTGDVTLNGTTHPETFQVVRMDSRYRLGGEITQTTFGIKPYSTMIGALRVSDSVVVEIEVRLGSGG